MPKSAKQRLRLKSEKFKKAETTRYNALCHKIDLLAVIIRKNG